GRRHSYDSSPSICCFGCEDAQERTPPGILDALGKMVVPEHVGCLQVLVVDGVVGLNQSPSHLVMKVLSLAARVLMRPGKQRHRLASAVASLLAPAHPALGDLQRPFGLAIPARRQDARAV